MNKSSAHSKKELGEFRELLLSVLSHYEYMSLEKILLDLPSSEILTNYQFDLTDLHFMLKKLTYEGRLRSISRGRDKSWKKVFIYRRSFFFKGLHFLREFFKFS